MTAGDIRDDRDPECRGETSNGRKTAFRKHLALLSALCLVLAACAAPYLQNTVPSEGFTNFETEPVRPLNLSADGRYLYALNTPDDRLEIFEATNNGLRSVGETAVGLRPVSLTLRNEHELWVVNHLSDTVNVVDVSNPARPHVMRVLAVGDEPRGIVAAGPGRRWVFVAAARRGENLTPGIGRAQLWAFDAEKPGSPPQVMTLFGTKPRALAVSPDGSRVYAAIFHSGNGTAVVGGREIARITGAPAASAELPPARDGVPRSGIIVRREGERWQDEKGRDWSVGIPFDLPDYDVFVIDASGDEPVLSDRISGVGTVLFDIAVRPDNGEVWVSNTEAENLTAHEPRLRGRFATNRITRLVPADGGWRVRPVDLNPHLANRISAGPAERVRSVAQPLQTVFDPRDGTGYVAAFGSGRVAVVDTEGTVTGGIDVGFGPAGLALNPARERLYVLNRLDGTISVIDTEERRTVATVPLRHDPTPRPIKNGRRLLYDAQAFSGNGTLSCATCHVFADFDGLAWDLGSPDGAVRQIPASLHHDLFPPFQSFHPLKGPMTTQSLRGLRDTAPYHWRGDRFGRDSRVPGEDIPSFTDFDRAFVDLMGMDEQPSDTDMEAFARFALTVRYPPNPNERLDRRKTPLQKRGFDFFTGEFDSDRGFRNCADCHAAPHGTNRRINAEGFDLNRDMKTPHLRNAYQKVGRFNESGPQVAGFGFVHDGSLGTVVEFLRLDAFEFPGDSEAEKDAIRRELHLFVMGFHTGMAPAVGRQVVVRGKPDEAQGDLLSRLAERAALGECDLVARFRTGAGEQGWLWRDGAFAGNSAAASSLGLDALLERAGAEPVNFLCVPPGDGVRSALDRDLDGILDGDEARGDRSGRAVGVK